MLDAHGSTVSFLDGAVTAPVELRTDPCRMEGRADGLFEHQVAIKVVTPESAGPEVIERFERGASDTGLARTSEYCASLRRRLHRRRLALLRHGVCRGQADRPMVRRSQTQHRRTRPTVSRCLRRRAVSSSTPRHSSRLKAREHPCHPGRHGETARFRHRQITPLSDLYSLGVILYELVTGRRPYRLKSRVFHEIVRIVCEEPPTRPSSVVIETEVRPGEEGKTITIAPGVFSGLLEGTPSDLKRRLSGDLDGILLKALEKDPRRRYRTVEQFSTDLDRHLKGEPVLVARAGRFSDAVRSSSKHRLGIALALGLLLAFVTGGIRIDWRGIALVAGTAAALGLWHIATDRELGAMISETSFAPRARSRARHLYADGPAFS